MSSMNKSFTMKTTYPQSSIASATRTDCQLWFPRGYVLMTAMAALLAASVGLNVVLARRVQSFRQIQSLTASDRLLKIGTTVPPIAAKRLDGHRDVISYPDTEQPTVLYIFTPTCIW